MPDSMMAVQDERIAIISHTHPSVTKGGAEVAAYALYCGLREIGADAIFIAACASADRGRLSLGSAREFAVMVEPDRYEHFYHTGEPSVARRLRAILARERITLANFHHFLNFGSNAVRCISEMTVGDEPASPKIDIVLTLHEFLAICHHHGQMVTKPARRLCSAATPHACATCFPEHTPQQFEQRQETILKALGDLAGYVSPSRFLAERMAAFGIPAGRMAIIENGLRDSPAERPKRPARAEGARFVFGYFGQITPFKGVDKLLDAIDIIGKIELLTERIEIRIHGNMIGQTKAFTDHFEESLAKHSFMVYSGAYNNADVATLMGECDYVVVPSTWWENSPVVIQEAFAAGCPVICSGIGGMAEKVTDGVSGLHVKVGSAADLARAIGQAADPVMHSRLAGGVPAVTDYVDMAQAYNLLYQSLSTRRNLSSENLRIGGEAVRTNLPAGRGLAVPSTMRG